MEENKKSAISDEALEKVAGGRIEKSKLGSSDYTKVTCDCCGAVGYETVLGETIVSGTEYKDVTSGGFFDQFCAPGGFICARCFKEKFGSKPKDASIFLQKLHYPDLHIPIK